jgi:hypothetical protein
MRKGRARARERERERERESRRAIASERGKWGGKGKGARKE